MIELKRIILQTWGIHLTEIHSSFQAHRDIYASKVFFFQGGKATKQQILINTRNNIENTFSYCNAI